MQIESAYVTLSCIVAIFVTKAIFVFSANFISTLQNVIGFSWSEPYMTLCIGFRWSGMMQTETGFGWCAFGPGLELEVHFEHKCHLVMYDQFIKLSIMIIF